MVRLSSVLWFSKIVLRFCAQMGHGPLELGALIFQSSSFLRSSRPWSAWVYWTMVRLSVFVFEGLLVFAFKWTVVRLSLVLWFLKGCSWYLRSHAPWSVWAFFLQDLFSFQVDHGPFEPLAWMFKKVNLFRPQMYHGPFEWIFEGFFYFCTLMDHDPFEMFALIFQCASWFLRSNGSWVPWVIYSFLLAFALKWTMLRLFEGSSWYLRSNGQWSVWVFYLKEISALAYEWTMVRLSLLVVYL